jgi:hypothetical protein
LNGRVVRSCAQLGGGAGEYNITFSTPTLVDRVVLREDIAHGQVRTDSLVRLTYLAVRVR